MNRNPVRESKKLLRAMRKKNKSYLIIILLSFDEAAMLYEVMMFLEPNAIVLLTIQRDNSGKLPAIILNLSDDRG